VPDKEGVDKGHCLWCKLKLSEWQTHGHERGVKWTLHELKQVSDSLINGKTENGVKAALNLTVLNQSGSSFHSHM
jgi:hypothetical protein